MLAIFCSFASVKHWSTLALPRIATAVHSNNVCAGYPMSVEAIAEIITYLNRHDFASADAPDPGLPLFADATRVKALYANLHLGTRFQPLLDLQTDTFTAHEAFVLVQTACPQKGSEHCALTPEDIFFLPGNVPQITHLDRLTRTLHTLNFLIHNPEGTLHLNVHPHHLLAVDSDHGEVFEGILSQCGLAPQSIVLEVSEHAIREKSRLASAVAAWQSRGYRIAVDNFGLAHLQIERVLRLRPDLIKIDRGYFRKCASRPQHLRGLHKTLARLRGHGVASAVVGVESQADLTLARAAGADYAQGYLFGEPGLGLSTTDAFDGPAPVLAPAHIKTYTPTASAVVSARRVVEG